MKLFEVTNGWVGESAVRCLVIAESENAALESAREVYKANPNLGYNEFFYKELQAKELCPDTSLPWAGELTDD